MDQVLYIFHLSRMNQVLFIFSLSHMDQVLLIFFSKPHMLQVLLYFSFKTYGSNSNLIHIVYEVCFISYSYFTFFTHGSSFIQFYYLLIPHGLSPVYNFQLAHIVLILCILHFYLSRMLYT